MCRYFFSICQFYRRTSSSAIVVVIKRQIKIMIHMQIVTKVMYNLERTSMQFVGKAFAQSERCVRFRSPATESMVTTKHINN